MKKIKRTLAIILVIAIAVLELPLSAFALENIDAAKNMSKWDGSIASGFASGSGTEIDPYIISTSSELAYLAKEVNNGRDFEGEHISLENDIDLQNKPWTPIGKVTSNIASTQDLKKEICVPFSGIFEGNSHTIYNVSFGNNYPYFYMGLFAVSFGTIQNIYVENLDMVYPKSTYDPTSFIERHYYAGIVTFQIGGIIDNCHYSGNVTSSFSACSGIVYNAKDSIVKNCTSSGSITYVGVDSDIFPNCSGIVTFCSSSKVQNCINYMKLKLGNDGACGGGISKGATGISEYYNCINYGDITSYDSSSSGIVELAEGTTKLNDCKNYGNIMAVGASSGIVGAMISGKILNCSNYGDIYVIGSDAAGILTCPHSSDTIINIENCFNKGNITTEGSYAGGIIAWGWLKNTTIKNCYNTGDITGINPEYSYKTCGGISGANSGSGARILFCYNTGTISYKATKAAICYGTSGSKYDVDFCYYLDNISIGVGYNLNSNATVKKLTSSEMKLQQNYKEFDFKNTWAISPDKNGGYPYLKNNPEVNPTDTSFINFSKTKNELEYPIFSEESFAKQLKVWINESDYFRPFEKFLSDYTYEELLYKTIDIPVMDSASGTAFNIAGQTQVKDLMAYIIFSDRAQKYINNVMINVNAKIASNDINDAFEYFLEKLKLFNIQYFYFQNNLNGDDAFNEGLQSLLLAKTAMAIVDELKVTFKNGETEYIILNKQGKTIDEFIEEHKENITAAIPLKSYSYLTDIYKAYLADSSENFYYDDLKYYILSGGDTSYLNPAYSSSLKGYSTFIKDSKFVIKSVKGSGATIDVDSLITLGLDNLSYFSDRFDSKTAKKIKSAKEGYEYFSTATDLVNAISSASLFGVVSGTWSLSNTYIDEVKKVYQNAESTEAGWYAFTYYYLSEENPDLLKAMINLDNGSASWNFDGMTLYGFPCDHNDKLQNAIVNYYCQKQSYLEHIYTPAEDFRMYLLNAANTLNTITNIDCEAYKNDLIEYLLAKLNSEVDSRGLKFKVETISNIANAGTISGSGVYLADSNVSIIAEASDGYKFTGWLDLTTGETVSTQNIYSFKATRDHRFSAQFISDNEDAFCLPTIVSQSQSASYYLGQDIQALCINASIDDLDDLSVSWYQTPYSSETGGTLVYEGNSFVPSIAEIGNYYYYAIVKNVKNPSAKVYSKPICLTIKKPLITDLQILKEPTQKIYFTNEAFNKTGMSVNLLYSDGSTQNVSDYIVNYDFSTEGNKTIVIEYGPYSKPLSVQVSMIRSGTLSDNISFVYDKNTKELVYSGFGNLTSNARVYQIANSNFINTNDIETVKIQNGITSLPASMFSRCYALKDIILSTDITSIPNMCFESCRNINEIVLPENITNIGNYSFRGCYGLQSINIPNSVTGIGNYAFAYCDNLTSLNIPVNVTNIGTDAFYSCDNLALTVIENSYAHTYAIENNIPYILEKLPELKIAGATLTLYDDISVNYMVSKDLFEGTAYTNPYMVFEFNGKQTKVTNYTISGNYYCFSFANVAPDKMNDTIKSTLYASVGDTLLSSDTREYSIAEYCYSMLDYYSTDAYANLRTLLVDLLNYGAYTQNYTGHNTENFVNANLTDEQKVWASGDIETFTDALNTKYATVDNPTVKWRGAELELNSAITMKFLIQTDSIEGLTVKITDDNGHSWTVKSSTFKKYADGYYYVYFNGLDASQMSDNIYLTVYSGDTIVSNTVRYSIESYVSAMKDSTNNKLSTLVHSMMKYGNSAKQYKNKGVN